MAIPHGTARGSQDGEWTQEGHQEGGWTGQDTGNTQGPGSDQHTQARAVTDHRQTQGASQL